MLGNNDKVNIDLSVLASLRDFQQPGEADFVTELIDLFLSDTTTQIELLRIAVATNDVNELRRLAHLLKGSSANMGARRMTELYEAMEKNVLADGSAHSQFMMLELEFERVGKVLNSERDKPRAAEEPQGLSQ